MMSGTDRPDKASPSDALGVFLEYSNGPAFFLSPDHVVLRATRAGAELFGYTGRQEMEGLSIFSVLRDPVLVLLARRWLDDLDRGNDISEEFPIENEGRSGLAWYRVSGRNILSEGRLLGKFISISDITEDHSHRKILATLMDSLPGEVLIFDRDYRIIMISEAIARANGFHFWHEAVGRSVRDLSTIDFHALGNLIDRIILNDVPIHEVVREHLPDSQPRWLLLDLRVITSTAGTFGYMMTRFDITGEVRPKAILESLMDSASDSISIMDADGHLEYVSRSFAEQLGHHSWRSTVNRPWEYLFSYNEHLSAQYAELFNHQRDGARSGTLSVDTGDGKRFFNYRVDPLTHEGESLGWLTISSNTTELVAARNRAESAALSKAAFLANMSHELRTPMNAVLGMNELLSRTTLTPIQKNYVIQMRSSATLLLSIINDILDFSRIEDRKMELSVAEYRVADVLRDVTNLIAVKIAEKELSFTVDIQPDVPAILVGDALRVKQIVINLLSNAVKFTQRGSVSLSVSAQQKGAARVALSLSVRDTGMGIPRAKQAELFERFTRVDHRGSAMIEGSGLGLSICKGLVGLMDGAMTLESDEGKGSTFTARITQTVPGDSTPIARFPPVAGRAMLAYDPDPAARESFAQLARHGGLPAKLCGTPSEFTDCLGGVDFPWTHVVFDWRSVGAKAAEASRRFPGVRWLALLTLNDFLGEGKPAALDFVFKPLFVDTFADFLSGKPVDFSATLPMASTLGVDGLWFKTVGARALVVDDNTVNLKVIRGFLESFAISVDEAGSGEEALALAAKGHYDLIFMDHIMPGLDGVETTRRLRALPGRDLVPIIALTANTATSNRELYQGAGMNDTLFKPVDFNALVPCLRKWLSPEKIVATEDQQQAGRSAGPANEGADKALGSGSGGDWVVGLDLETGIGYTGSRKNLEMVIKVFNRTGPRMLEQLEAGRHSGDQAKFRVAVHSLVSSCANIGATELSAHAATLEEAIISGNAEAVDSLFGVVHAGLSDAIANVAAWFASKGAVSGGAS